MGQKGKDDEEKTITSCRPIQFDFYDNAYPAENPRFTCPLCGMELYPRKFLFEDEPPVWGIFDNCKPFNEQMVYATMKEAIEAYEKD